MSKIERHEEIDPSEIDDDAVYRSLKRAADILGIKQKKPSPQTEHSENPPKRHPDVSQKPTA